VATSTIHITGSLQVGDVWMLLAGIAVLLSPAAMADVLRLVTGSYGVIALMLTGCMLIGSLNSRTFLHSISFVAQMVFVLWVPVPVVAAGGTHARSAAVHPVGRAGYLAVPSGSCSCSAPGKTRSLRMTIGRVFQWPVTHVFQMSPGGSAAGLADITPVGTGTSPPFVHSNFAERVPYRARRFRPAGSARPLCSAHARATTAWVLADRPSRRRTALGVPFSGPVADPGVGTSFLEDDIRLRSVMVSWRAVRSSKMTMLFGDGWGMRGRHRRAQCRRPGVARCLCWSRCCC
jgi:hypothetical protein